MKNYVKFMLLGTCLLTADLYAGEIEQITNPLKEEQTEFGKVSVEELIGVAKGLHKVIDDANNGSKDSQDQVARTLNRYSQLLFSDLLIHKINIGEWQNLEERVQKNPELLSLIVGTKLSTKISENVRKNIFNVLNDKHNAKQASADEINLLGICYDNGEGVAKNNKRAFELYEQAAELGHAGAITNLGACYRNGEGVPQDNKKAVKFFSKAAELGHAEAMFNLGFMYAGGLGVPQNHEEAAKLYKQAAELGHAEAIFNLGVRYEKGRGVLQDHKEAVKYYEQGAGLGHAYGMYNLGVMYEIGRGVPQDYEMAAKLYKQAAELGDADAMFNLGVMYARGLGVPQNHKEAVKIYKQAADLGSVGAMCNMGLCYQDGAGVDKNLITALKWHLKSIEFKNNPHKNLLIDPIKKLISLKTTTDDSSNLLDSFKNTGLIFDINHNNQQLILEDIMAFHILKKQSYRGNFEEKGLDPHGVKSEAHNVVSDFAGKLLSFVTRITSMDVLSDKNKEDSKNPNNNNNIVEEIKFKAFQMPIGFMLTNVEPSEDLLAQYGIDKSINVQNSVFSISKFGSYEFYNVGLDAVKLADELQNCISKSPAVIEKIKNLIAIENNEVVLENHRNMIDLHRKQLDLIEEAIKLVTQKTELCEMAESLEKQRVISKSSINDLELTIEKIKVKKIDEKLIEHLQSHKDFVENLEENLGYALSKSAGSRNKAFEELIGIN